ncbi:LysR family transcriptional regulator [Microbacterium gorillae]|uniref:LysR family transcriptional regulator n=1 Tax=Microbacterium gorillae TaxID=1231063 RepID=UPI00069394F1|nr:LysR family transcriptional regulator [Microbacterium gorillae]
MRTLGITELRSLIAVAAFAGVGRAAEALHLAQPTVSAHLRQLESETGVALVRRHGRSIAFTAAGEELVRDAYRLIALHDEAIDHLAASEPDAFRVASTDMASAATLHTVSRVLRTLHPDQPSRFRFHRTDKLREFAQSHEMDIIIGLGPLGPDTIALGDVPVAWFASSTVASGPGLVLFTAPCLLREAIVDSAIGRQRAVVRECLDLTSVLTAVRSGVGITALPVTHRGESGLRELTDLPAPRDLHLSMVVSSRVPRETTRTLARELRGEPVRVAAG